MRRVLTIVIFVVIFIAGVTFSAINTVPVDVNYYLGTISAPLSAIIILSLVAGIFLGAVLIYIGNLRLRYENRRLNKKLALFVQEIDSLRILPIKESL